MKRVLLFVLLLAIGWLAMRLAIGEDEVVKATEQRSAPSPTATRDDPGGLELRHDRYTATITQTGRLELPRHREVPQPDGTVRYEPVFVLRAADSRPARAGLQQLEGAEVDLFDEGRPVALLTAREAFVELGADDSGKPSLREDKDIDLRDAVFEGRPGTRLAGLRLELGHARAKVTADELLLQTAAETDLVVLTLAGERSGRLEGRGLRAQLPRDTRRPGARTRIELLHEPVVTSGGLVARAAGRLLYDEDPSRGAADLWLFDDVHVQLEPRALSLPGAESETAAPPQPAVARGDRLRVFVQRLGAATGGGARGSGDGAAGRRVQASWDHLQLEGSPATVDAEGLHVASPRLDVLAGPFGEPYAVTATGDSRVDFTVPPTGGGAPEPATGTSARRIALLLPDALAGAQLRSFGFPRWTLRPIAATHAVVFEGQTRFTAPRRDVEASDGLHVVELDRRTRSLRARGAGAVRIEQQDEREGQPPTTACGSDGFVIGTSPGADGDWALRLGPDPAVADADAAAASARWRAHRYEVRRGDLRLRGTGSCLLHRAGTATVVELEAPEPTITAQLERAGAALYDLRFLHATTVADADGADALGSLFAAGTPAMAVMVRDHETVTASAPAIERSGPSSLRLSPPPSTGDYSSGHLWGDLDARDRLPVVQLDRDGTHGRERVRGTGSWIDVHHLGGDDVLVDFVADADVRAAVDATIAARASGTPTTVRLDAARIRLLPFTITREARLAHAGGATHGTAVLPFVGASRPWVVADDVQNLRVVDDQHGIVEGAGARVVLSAGAQAGLFAGDAARCQPARVLRRLSGRTVVAEGPRIRVFRDTDTRLTALATFADGGVRLPPVVTLQQPAADPALAHVAAVCDGPVDVLPHAVEFGGPVTTRSLFADGSTDPDGLGIDAGRLRLDRRRDTGELIGAAAERVQVRWAGLAARSATVEMDLRRGLCKARDPEGAELVMPNGGRFTAPVIEANYLTMRVSCYHGTYSGTMSSPR